MQYKKIQKSSWNEPYSSPSLNNRVGEGHSSFLLLLLLLLFFKPTSTKPQAGKLG